MAFTPDRLPVVAPWPDAAGRSIGGFSGNGMSLSLILARLIGDMLPGRPADPHLVIFTPDRFNGAAA
jgi:glycine/D-amino acid oxidase-like deaminating enzyme